MPLSYSPRKIAQIAYFVKIKVTTHVTRLKLFRLKAEGVRKARLPYSDGM